MWTQFWDMNSGGGKKEQWRLIYIEAPEEEAKVIFYNRFGHSPKRISCTCCGEDYSISEEESLAQMTGYHRGCRYTEGGLYLEPGEPIPAGDRLSKWSGVGSAASASGGMTLDEYLAKPDVLAIPASLIKDEERKGSVPEQGYVWVG